MNDRLLEVTTEVYYLKMNTKPNFTNEKSKILHTNFKNLPSTITTDDYLFYYQAVGKAYNWLDRILINRIPRRLRRV